MIAKHSTSTSGRHDAGSALLLVIWAIIMISAALMAWVTWAQTDLERSAIASRDMEARAMAHSGIAIALHPQVSEKTPGLEESLNGQMGFRVRIMGEGGRLNINWLITEEQQPRLDMLKRWLELHGLTFEEREAFVDSLLDYVDADNVVRLNGAEDEPGYTPANRPLQSLDELEHVKNAGPLLRSPGWKDELTIYSSGPIDLSSASEEILRLIPGFGEARITRFLQLRRGRDGVDATEDDMQFKNFGDIGKWLGMSNVQLQELQRFSIVKDTTQRIISEGYSADVVRQIDVVAQKSGANPAIRYWKE
jgi:type II secretory pathway component PulK